VTPPPATDSRTAAPLKGQLGDPRGGGQSQWEPIKILLLRENSGYTPNSQLRIPARVFQGHVVTTDLPTLRTNPKRSRSRSTNQEAKDLASCVVPGRRSASLGRTVRGHWADGPLPTGGWSVKCNRTPRRALQHTDGPNLVHRRSASNWCRADGPRCLGGRSAKYLPAKNNWPTRSKQKRSRTQRTRRTPGRTSPCGQSACYPRTIHQAREQQPEPETENTKAHIRPWISQTVEALEERFGEDVKRP
jgi:hypothetical protein